MFFFFWNLFYICLNRWEYLFLFHDVFDFFLNIRMVAISRKAINLFFSFFAKKYKAKEWDKLSLHKKAYKWKKFFWIWNMNTKIFFGTTSPLFKRILFIFNTCHELITFCRKINNIFVIRRQVTTPNRLVYDTNKSKPMISPPEVV